jgi:hypothetical protein
MINRSVKLILMTVPVLLESVKEVDLAVTVPKFRMDLYISETTFTNVTNDRSGVQCNQLLGEGIMTGVQIIDKESFLLLTDQHLSEIGGKQFPYISATTCVLPFNQTKAARAAALGNLIMMMALEKKL